MLEELENSIDIQPSCWEGIWKNELRFAPPVIISPIYYNILHLYKPSKCVLNVPPSQVLFKIVFDNNLDEICSPISRVSKPV